MFERVEYVNIDITGRLNKDWIKYAQDAPIFGRNSFDVC